MLFCPKFTYYYNKLQVSGQKKSPYAWFLTSLPVVLPFSHRVEMLFAPTDGPEALFSVWGRKVRLEGNSWLLSEGIKKGM